MNFMPPPPSLILALKRDTLSIDGLVKPQEYIEEMIEKNRSVWEEKYKEDTPNLAPIEIHSSFEAFLCTYVTL